MVGIYRYYNVINHKSYIGQFVRIEERRKCHELCAFRDTESNKEYYKALYKDMRAHGLDKFEFEILELCEKENLDVREQYWIKYYNSYNTGYNKTEGGERGSKMEGEEHPNHKLTAQQVYDIREAYANHNFVWDVFEKYSNLINYTGFHRVWNGYTWRKIHMDVYSEENKNWHKMARNSHPGKTTGGRKGKRSAQLPAEEIRSIRNRLGMGETRDKIWEDYKNSFAYRQTFNNICDYKTYKFL